MLMVGSRSYLFEYKFNKTTGAQISAGAGPGGSALTVSQSRAQVPPPHTPKTPNQQTGLGVLYELVR